MNNNNFGNVTPATSIPYSSTNFISAYTTGGNIITATVGYNISTSITTNGQSAQGYLYNLPHSTSWSTNLLPDSSDDDPRMAFPWNQDIEDYMRAAITTGTLDPIVKNVKQWTSDNMRIIMHGYSTKNAPMHDWVAITSERVKNISRLISELTAPVPDVI